MIIHFVGTIQRLEQHMVRYDLSTAIHGTLPEARDI